jgi:hypothetical protein
MAVSTIVSVTQYAGNDSIVTPYPTVFAFQDASWLRVYVTPLDGVSTLLTSGTHYSVTGAGDIAGGNITMLAAYPATTTITLARITPPTQLLDMEYNDRLPAQLVEDALDKLTFAVQELVGDRPLRFPPTEPLANDTELPDPSARKGSVLGFDAASGEAVLMTLPLPVVPVAAPDAGTYVLASVNGVLGWKGTVNCA